MVELTAPHGFVMVESKHNNFLVKVTNCCSEPPSSVLGFSRYEQSRPFNVRVKMNLSSRALLILVALAVFCIRSS